jgi:hypothetical protein
MVRRIRTMRMKTMSANRLPVLRAFRGVASRGPVLPGSLRLGLVLMVGLTVGLTIVPGILGAGEARGAEPASDVVMRAMQDEIDRSMKELKMEDLDLPYFIAYRIDEISASEAAATFGSLTSMDTGRQRSLTVEIRVGARELDNTNFMSMSSLQNGSIFRQMSAGNQMPLDDDYQEIRRKIWLATDSAFKEALEAISQKRAALQNKTRTDELPDFTVEAAASAAADPPPALPDSGMIEGRVRELSNLFRSMPDVSSSSVSIRCRNVYTRYLNSEGTRFTRAIPEARFECTAEAFATDGLPIKDFVAAYGHRFEELPSQDKLAADIKEMGKRIADLKGATLLESYSGPVLFEGEAAAEILAQGFVPELIGKRKVLTDDPQLEMFLQQKESALAAKVGVRVLPAFLTIEDDPTLPRVGNDRLVGDYTIDDDGVLARKTVLIENGLLKGFLASRNPGRGVTNSTGSRRGNNIAPGNLIVTAKDGLSDKALREKLLETAKEAGLDYAIVVRRMADPVVTPSDDDPMAMMRRMMAGGGEGTDVEPLIAAYKVTADGKEILLRNLEIGDLNAGSFKDIVAASQSRTVMALPFAGGGGSASMRRLMSMVVMRGGGGTPPPLATIVTPSLLFEDLSLKKPSGEIPTPPIAAHPFFDK